MFYDGDDNGSMHYLVRHSEPAKQWKISQNNTFQVKWSTTYEQVMDQRQWCFSFHELKIRITVSV